MTAKKKIQTFIEAQPLTVVSTVDERSRPESALVSFYATEAFEVFFVSEKSRRKNINLSNNPQIAFVFGFTGPITVQYVGRARILNKQEAKPYLRAFFAKSPGSKEFHDNPDEEYFLISPRWIRYSDYSKQPFEILEESFKDVD